MKIVELTNALLLPLTNEEHDLLKKFVNNEPVPKHQLEEREQLLANNLTQKDVLLRTNDAGKIYYKKRIS
jgi:hypothetical protein